MVRTSICLLAGAMALQLISFPPGSDLFVALLVALVLLWPWLCRNDLLLVLAGGMLYWQASASIADSRLDSRFEGDSLLTTVRVVEFPRIRDGAASFVASPRNDDRVPGRVRLTWIDPPVEPRLGDVWRVEIRLRRPHGASNPGGMDAEAWLHRERIGATGYVVAGRHNRLLDSLTETGTARLRSRYADYVDSVLGRTEASAVILAVTIGARHRMTAGQWQRYAATGTSHLMAISGLHVGLAALAAYGSLIFALGLTGYAQARRAAWVGALAVAVAYSAISGFAVPSQRAVLMLAFVTTAFAVRRDIDGTRVLAIALFLIVGIAPISTMQPGFKLSFAAVAVLLWWSRHARFDSVRSGSLVSAQFALFFALVPLTVLIFGRVSFVSPIVNLMAVPIFSIVTVPAALLSVVLPDVPASWLLHIASISIDVIDGVALSTASRPGSWQATTLFAGAATLLVALPLSWLAPRGWPGRYLAIIGLLAIVTWKPRPVPAGCVDVWTLDVGHGLATAIVSRDRLLLYDTGASWREGDSIASRTIIPWMRALGRGRIDELVVSHADNDHAGGIDALLDQVQVSTILASEPLPGLEAEACHAGLSWDRADTNFRVLSPRKEGATGNDASCVLLVTVGDYRVLLTGDIESEAESRLVRSRLLPQADIVSVPHHGSLTSSTPAFVAAVEPEIAIVSSGRGNQWGFPKPHVVARWRAVGARVLNTADSGAIAVRVCRDSGVGAPREWREQRRRIWHDPDS